MPDRALPSMVFSKSQHLYGGVPPPTPTLTWLQFLPFVLFSTAHRLLAIATENEEMREKASYLQEIGLPTRITLLFSSLVSC